MPTPQVFTTTVIKPALMQLGLYSPAAEQLLLATAIQESHLKYRRQIGGPALSYFPIEPNTHNDKYAAAIARIHYLRVPAAK